MTDQVFELENFRGPLDLLLHLIREQEMEITEVDLSQLCDQYLHAVELMKAVDIDVAGEFLVMAATLILIKSRTVLPREEEVDLAEELDPADELIQQLLEYRKYKTLSIELDRRAQERRHRATRGTHEVPPDEEDQLEEIGLWDLVGSLVRLMEELGLRREFDTLKAEKPLAAYLRETLARLAERDRWTLRELVVGAGDDGAVLGVFLSLLELVKSRQIRVHQAQGPDGQEIEVELRQDRDHSRLAFLYDEEAPEREPSAAGDEPEPDAEQAPEGAAVTSPALDASDPDSKVSPSASPPV